MERELLKCNRCNYQWMPNYPYAEPKHCPKCNSPYWNKERQKPIRVVTTETVN